MSEVAVSTLVPGIDKIQVKWNGPFVGEIVGSVGEDGLIRIWQEDVAARPGSGRRFKRIYEQPSASRVPYMSLDFKNIGTETYLAMVSRDGQLTVCEPIDHDDLSDWHILWQDYLGHAPSRTEETGFRICWHHEKLPAWPSIVAGLDRKSLSLAVSCLDTVKVFRTDKDRKFYTAAELTGPRTLIRDVAWSNGSMRGYDTIATASKDGKIRVYELHTVAESDSAKNADTTAGEDNASHRLSHTSVDRPLRSGIGAGLAGVAPGSRIEEDNRPGKVVQESKMVAELSGHARAAWRVGFSFMGELADDNCIEYLMLSCCQAICSFQQVMMALSLSGKRTSINSGCNTRKSMR